MANTLHLGLLNVNGLRSKIQVLRNLVQPKNCDIFCVQESKLTDSFIAIPSYVAKRFDGKDGHGGLVIYMSPNIFTAKQIEYHREPVVTGYLEFAVIEASKNGQRFIIIYAYTNRTSAEALQYLEDFCKKKYGERLKELVIVGDLNSDVLQYPNIGKLADKVGGVQTVRQPTHGKAILDVVITGDVGKHVRTDVLANSESCGSDHNGVIVDLKCGGLIDDDEVIVLDDSDDEEASMKVGIESKKLWPCEYEGCGKEFTRRNNLQKHVECYHSEFSDFPCLECGKKFNSKSNLHRHRISHLDPDELPFQCQECSAKFGDKSHLNRHIASVHRGEKRYQCEQCGKRFAESHQLKHHERIHTGETSYACKYCDMRFTDSRNHQRHQRQHSDEPKFACPTCGKKFSQKRNVYAHSVVHAGEKPYKCENCDKAYTSKRNLTFHLLRCHSDHS